MADAAMAAKIIDGRIYAEHLRAASRLGSVLITLAEMSEA